MGAAEFKLDSERLRVSERHAGEKPPQHRGAVRLSDRGKRKQVAWGRWSGFSRLVQVHRSTRWTAEFTVRVDYSEHTQDEISGQKHTGGVDVQGN